MHSTHSWMLITCSSHVKCVRNITILHNWDTAIHSNLETPMLPNSLLSESLCCMNQRLCMFFKVDTFDWLQGFSELHSTLNSDPVTDRQSGVIDPYPHSWRDECLRVSAWKTSGKRGKVPEGMTFACCHQLYQALIKYRLRAILVLTYLRAGSMGNGWRGHSRNLRGHQVDKYKMRTTVTQRMTLMLNIYLWVRQA